DTVADRIQLLPDHIANQIAAGEVIQRPASAVKELLENAVDAGATSIKLIITDGGKSLIQVIDNGAGMSETDARMCFERHATSKIKNIDDLFHIRTMGFRGEALASIAAVAQVELMTKREKDEVGTYIEIENSLVIKQQPVAAPAGTSIAMKNLFFNVPARRNFLKSNASELRHIVDEFTRIALAFPGIVFTLTNNGQEVFHLEEGSLKGRILQLLGNHYNAKLVSVKEETDYLTIYGFAGKPETAKRTRGDQYFFVNNRFIKSAYLNHAVINAYQDMITPDSFPAYVLFIDLDPAVVDVNVHPTKQEIKFEDEKIIYAFVQAAIKHALAQFSITPTLDFDLDASIQRLDAIQKPFTEDKQTATRSSSIFQTFTEANQAHKIELEKENNLKHWDEYKPIVQAGQRENFESPLKENSGSFLHPHNLFNDSKPIQLFNTYILITVSNSFLLIHQQFAHERIIYEQLVEALNGKAMATQQSLFPSNIELAPADAVLLTELLPDLLQMGYSIEPFGKHSFVIQGTPADLHAGNEKQVVEKIIEQYKNFTPELKLSNREMLIRSVCWQQAIKSGTPLSEKEMQGLLTDLFQCKQPNTTPNGKPTYTDFKKESLEKIFGR
ncbi:MAG TPA: DNA mismatch repair endonuclease MutL, partial [Chitinophagaceae bacterium]|nr:DNA mismatch repair endonuclease MutL [Chitinophagaceae bacterium]